MTQPKNLKGPLKANVSHERSNTEARAFFRDG